MFNSPVTPLVTVTLSPPVTTPAPAATPPPNQASPRTRATPPTQHRRPQPALPGGSRLKRPPETTQSSSAQSQLGNSSLQTPSRPRASAPDAQRRTQHPRSPALAHIPTANDTGIDTNDTPASPRLVWPFAESQGAFDWKSTAAIITDLARYWAKAPAFFGLGCQETPLSSFVSSSPITKPV
ncbi:hypothetical protein EIP91_000120 [Steccherinum ochraceum]|uniref:Uncharacterized protein n=1 Tax=Steccherinum ochraceum TaxID=92696 RepID=A0A4R0S2U5_9APHY|nr:hypothetical protein EIP91_000120 [Steccherinum ochraceum]